MNPLTKIAVIVLLVAVSMGAGAAIYAQFGPPEPGVEADSPTLTEGEAIAVVQTWLAKRTVTLGSVQWDCLAVYTTYVGARWNAHYQNNGIWIVTASGNQDSGGWALYENTLSIVQLMVTLPTC